MRHAGIFAKMLLFAVLASSPCFLGGCLNALYAGKMIWEDVREGFRWSTIKNAPIYTPFGTFNTGKNEESSPEC